MIVMVLLSYKKVYKYFCCNTGAFFTDFCSTCCSSSTKGMNEKVATCKSFILPSATSLLSVKPAFPARGSLASRLTVPIRVFFCCLHENLLATVLLASFGFSWALFRINEVFRAYYICDGCSVACTRLCSVIVLKGRQSKLLASHDALSRWKREDMEQASIEALQSCKKIQHSGRWLLPSNF